MQISLICVCQATGHFVQGHPRNLHNLAVGITEFIVLITKVFPGVPQKQPAVFDVARSKHGYKMTKLEFRMTNE